MFPYENVKSIHDQKMAQFISEKEKAQMAKMRKAGRPGLVERVAGAVAGRFRSISGDGFGDTDSLVSVEGVMGSLYADSILGSGADFEAFEGSVGDDTIDGGDGFARRWARGRGSSRSASWDF